MPTYRAMGAVTLSIPNKLKPNGQPAAHAAWRAIAVPSGSRFTYSGTAAAFLAALCSAQPSLVKES